MNTHAYQVRKPGERRFVFERHLGADVYGKLKVKVGASN